MQALRICVLYGKMTIKYIYFIGIRNIHVCIFIYFKNCPHMNIFRTTEKKGIHLLLLQCFNNYKVFHALE